MAHIYNGILLSHKKERNSVICSEVDGPRENKTYVHIKLIMLITALFTVGKKWEQPPKTTHSLTDEWTKCGISIQWNIIQQ